MKIIYIRSTKPGLYCRRRVIYEGRWVTIKGIALLPAWSRYRKWAGLAIALPIERPAPLPTKYKYHSEKLKEPQLIDHYPEVKKYARR